MQPIKLIIISIVIVLGITYLLLWGKPRIDGFYYTGHQSSETFYFRFYKEKIYLYEGRKCDVLLGSYCSYEKNKAVAQVRGVEPFTIEAKWFRLVSQQNEKQFNNYRVFWDILNIAHVLRECPE